MWKASWQIKPDGKQIIGVLFEDVANYMMVNGEHNKTRPPLARCHWPRSVIVGWMCFRARGQFVYIEAGVLYFLHHAPLSARFPFSGIHRASQKELQHVQYLTFIISSQWSSLDPDWRVHSRSSEAFLWYFKDFSCLFFPPPLSLSRYEKDFSSQTHTFS